MIKINTLPSKIQLRFIKQYINSVLKFPTNLFTTLTLHVTAIQ